MKYVLICLALISIVGVFVTAYDKLASIGGKRRISEKTIFLLSFLGGSVFIYITMKIIRHKTLHKRFMIGLPCIIILQIALCVLIWYLTNFQFENIINLIFGARCNSSPAVQPASLYRLIRCNSEADGIVRIREDVYFVFCPKVFLPWGFFLGVIL